MYEVITKFVDLEDNNFLYNPGDIFPRAGIEASKKRIKELSSSKNKRKKPLIIFIENSKNNEGDQDVDKSKEPLTPEDVTDKEVDNSKEPLTPEEEGIQNSEKE